MHKDIQTSRTFKRTVHLGMRVWRSLTVNFELGFLVEHITLACPNYKLTDRGPVYRKKKDETIQRNK